MKNTVIYLRVSTDSQDFERQLNELKAYAKYKNYEIIEVFSEKISGVNKGLDRLEFKRLVRYVETTKVDNILVWEISRIGRKASDVLTNIDYFADKGINIYMFKENLNILDEQGKRNAMSLIVTSVLSSLAQLERETLIERTKSGKIEKVSKGGYSGGVILPYGYTHLNKMMVVEAGEAEIVKEIYNLYLQGQGTHQIAKILNQRNIPTKFGTTEQLKNKVKINKYGQEKTGIEVNWSAAGVRSILTNTLYMGKRKYSGNVYDCPAIVDDITFNKAQQTITKKVNLQGKHTKYPNHLHQLIKCGCGKNYYLISRGDNSYYQCVDKRDIENSCKSPALVANKLLQILYILNRVGIANYNVKNNHIQELNNKKKETELNIEILCTDIDKMNVQIDALLNVHLSGRINVSNYNKKYDEFQQELIKLNASLQAKKVELQQIIENLKRLKENINFDVDFSTAKELFKQVLTSIEIKEISNQNDFKHLKSQNNDFHTLITINSIYKSYDIIYTRYSKNFYVIPNPEYDVTTKTLKLKNDKNSIDFRKYVGVNIDDYMKSELQPEQLKIITQQLKQLTTTARG